MPKVTIYIREKDYPKWKVIKNKPEWLHNHINSTEYVEGYRRHKKAKPGTIDPVSGLEIDEFVTNANPKVDELMNSLYEPKLTPPEEVA